MSKGDKPIFNILHINMNQTINLLPNDNTKNVTESKTNSFTCPICLKPFYKAYNVKRHSINVHKVNLVECPKCYGLVCNLPQHYKNGNCPKKNIFYNLNNSTYFLSKKIYHK